ncbi:MAG TPA: cell division protein FtsK, partial [Flavobacterium sp.]|nr:cell division protein FtsK [Flavobacterium sp.]
MAKTTKAVSADKKSNSNSVEKKSWAITKQHKIVLGSLLVLFSIALLLAFISFFIYGQQDQSAVNQLSDRNETVQNWLGKFGAFLADLMIYKGFGVASFLFVRLFFLTGIFLVLDISSKKLNRIWFWDLFVIIILSVLLGFFATSLPELGGIIGYELNLFSQDYLGKTGTLLVLIFGLIIYLIFKIKVSPEKIKSFFERTKKEIKTDLNSNPTSIDSSFYNLEEYAV